MFHRLSPSSAITNICCLSYGEQGPRWEVATSFIKNSHEGFVCKRKERLLCTVPGTWEVVHQYLLNEENEHSPRNCVVILNVDWLIGKFIFLCYQIVIKLLACDL